MFSFGYCYGNDTGVRGYNQYNIAKTAAAAQREIRRILVKAGDPEENILFKESETNKGHFRAVIKNFEKLDVEVSTNYVYFKLPQTWILLDTTVGKKAVVDSGELEDMKFAARKYVGRTDVPHHPVVKFKRDGDTIKVSEGVYLVRIH